ncbi:hypothetical protein L0663_15140 [Dyadobacter sp. CY107]|uniref:hypothetical protein n=1 Tax=Dyadobacter fanqingshengii TaxID=2906443 RepID=UPI001F3E4C7B|nr:hypothetical protein [Dyadobacter fanqingshengii]MCF2504726.1 hypothetical protein [Dyadobacter fanqingshengii]
MEKKHVIITALFGLVLLSNPLFAQKLLTDKPAAERAKMQTQRMAGILKLDSAQIRKVESINLVYAQRLDPIMLGNANRMSKLKAVRALQSEKEAELKQVLSQEQFNQFKQQQQERKDEIRKNRKS